MDINKKLLNSLENPENEYRPFNYWGWLENIEPDEVRRQVKEMSGAGLGGYVMHARGGLTIPYMGEQWIMSIKAMVDEGNELGMISILDDEDGWPSGFGAGTVNGKGEEYWLKWLECEKIKYSELKTVSSTIGVYGLKENTAFRIKDTSVAENIDEEVLHIYYESSKYYVDNLDPKVVRHFIDASYEAYYNKLSSEFGKGIKAIFSDEPQLARDHIAWSLILPGEFIKRFGYDLLEVLPAIYYDFDGHEKVRYDFWSLLSSLFTDSYSRQISEWCTKHGVIFTGHTCYEEFFKNQVECSGSTMPFYEHMQIPGIDWLCRIPVDNMIIKQVTSVAQQFGKKRILSEMYGCAGWNVSFDELKWIGEWHYVLGINLMLQHLGLYSLRGSRKREYPASLFFQQPWWDEFKAFNDYFGRLSKLMSESEPVIDLLIIHPIRSAWIAYNRSCRDNLESNFKELTNKLLSLNFDFHYGDEEIILRHGKVERTEFIIGKYSYKAVLIPPSLSLATNTIELLATFADNGGTLISVGDYPHLAEGEPDEMIERLEQYVHKIENSVPQIENALCKVLKRKIYILNSDGSRNENVYCCTFKRKEETLYYIVNTNFQKGYEINIELENYGSIYRLDLSECKEETMNSLGNVYLEPAQSIVLVSRNNGAAVTGQCNRCYPGDSTGEIKLETKESISLEEGWELKKGHGNAITLDYCRYSIDKGPWEGEIPVIFLQEKLLALSKPVDVALKFSFTLDCIMEGNLYLIIEEPGNYIIYINGRRLDYMDEGWWIDKAFRKISIGKHVRQGENEIVMERRFYCSGKVYRIKNDKSIHEAEANRITVETELESIYLLGNFSVQMNGSIKDLDRRAIFAGRPFTLTVPVEKVSINNLETQGYPFFTGKLKMSKKFNIKELDRGGQKAELRFDRPDSIVTKVTINGFMVKTFLWAPYKADVTEFLKQGENEIEVELTNSCRNLLGPHHHAEGELYAVGQHSFKDKSNWTDNYCFIKYGVTGMTIEIK